MVLIAAEYDTRFVWNVVLGRNDFIEGIEELVCFLFVRQFCALFADEDDVSFGKSFSRCVVNHFDSCKLIIEVLPIVAMFQEVADFYRSAELLVFICAGNLAEPFKLGDVIIFNLLQKEELDNEKEFIAVSREFLVLGDKLLELERIHRLTQGTVLLSGLTGCWFGLGRRKIL